MEYSMESIALSFVVVTVVTLAWRVVNWVWLRPKKLEKILRQQGLKGNPYRLLYGDLREFAVMVKEAKARPISFDDDVAVRNNPFHHKLVKDYGKNSFIWYGPAPRVIIMNPDQVKEVFNKMNVFQRLDSSPLTKILSRGVTTYEGQKWEKHRKLLNPAFHQQKLKLMVPAMHQSCSEMITQWEKLVSAEQGSCEIDIWPFLSRFASDVISRTAFGSSYEEGRSMFLLQKELAALTVEVFRSVNIPGWRFVPTKRNRRMKELDKGIRASLMRIIKKKEKVIREGEAKKDDLLGILMETNLREIEEQNAGISLEDIIEECKLFYVAGQDTTSSLLCWTMIFLSKHQDWQERARQEVSQVLGKNKPDYDGLSRLKTVQMIFNEVLRLYPPACVLDRTVYEETKLGNLTLPAGTQICLPVVLVHHDPEIWGDDALEFKPERFAEGISKATRNQVCFIPFAWGPRICIGQNFSLLEAKMAMAMILQNFSFELSPSYVHAPTSAVALYPEFGAQLILRKM